MNKSLASTAARQMRDRVFDILGREHQAASLLTLALRRRTIWPYRLRQQ